MRDEFDFSKGVRGKDADRFAGGGKMVTLDPDVAAVFPPAEADQAALRTLAEGSKKAEVESPR